MSLIALSEDALQNLWSFLPTDDVYKLYRSGSTPLRLKILNGLQEFQVGGIKNSTRNFWPQLVYQLPKLRTFRLHWSFARCNHSIFDLRSLASRPLQHLHLALTDRQPLYPYIGVESIDATTATPSLKELFPLLRSLTVKDLSNTYNFVLGSKAWESLPSSLECLNLDNFRAQPLGPLATLLPMLHTLAIDSIISFDASSSFPGALRSLCLPHHQNPQLLEYFKPDIRANHLVMAGRDALEIDQHFFPLQLVTLKLPSQRGADKSIIPLLPRSLTEVSLNLKAGLDETDAQKLPRELIFLELLSDDGREDVLAADHWDHICKALPRTLTHLNIVPFTPDEEFEYSFNFWPKKLTSAPFLHTAHFSADFQLAEHLPKLAICHEIRLPLERLLTPETTNIQFSSEELNIGGRALLRAHTRVHTLIDFNLIEFRISKGTEHTFDAGLAHFNKIGSAPLKPLFSRDLEQAAIDNPDLPFGFFFVQQASQFRPHSLPVKLALQLSTKPDTFVFLPLVLPPQLKDMSLRVGDANTPDSLMDWFIFDYLRPEDLPNPNDVSRDTLDLLKAFIRVDHSSQSHTETEGPYLTSLESLTMLGNLTAIDQTVRLLRLPSTLTKLNLMFIQGDRLNNMIPNIPAALLSLSIHSLQLVGPGDFDFLPPSLHKLDLHSSNASYTLEDLRRLPPSLESLVLPYCQSLEVELQNTKTSGLDFLPTGLMTFSTNSRLRSTLQTEVAARLAKRQGDNVRITGAKDFASSVPRPVLT